MNESVELGKVAFNAYVKAKQGITYDGKPIPEWDKLTQEVQNGWVSAASAVREVDDGQAAAQLIALRGQIDEVLKPYNANAKPCETVSEGIVRLADLIRRYDAR